MSASDVISAHVAATVIEVLSKTGLAYLDGDDRRTWAITKSTTGTGLDRLHTGRRVLLTLARDHNFEYVSEYKALD